ncbi:MAG: flavin reductase family protein [Planctomycetota bacterium]|jgi:flavin reductase (DIM6/NTAB) family NADH-FMN oxidoreductase RutF
MNKPQRAEAIGLALAKIPSGAAIATATHEGKSAGLLASWIQQVAFEPPMICLAVKRGRPIEAVIDAAGTFVLNLVGEDGTGIFQHFSRGAAPSENAFEGLAVQHREAGPVLGDCLGHLACKVAAKHEAGDHNLYLAEVTAAAVDTAAKPYVHVRNTGLSY